MISEGSDSDEDEIARKLRDIQAKVSWLGFTLSTIMVVSLIANYYYVYFTFWQVENVNISYYAMTALLVLNPVIGIVLFKKTVDEHAIERKRPENYQWILCTPLYVLLVWQLKLGFMQSLLLRAMGIKQLDQK